MWGTAGPILAGGGDRSVFEPFWGDHQVEPVWKIEADSRSVTPRRKVLRASKSDVDPSHCSLQYVRIDNVVKQLLQLGPGVLMAKLDVSGTYRIVRDILKIVSFWKCRGSVWMQPCRLV